MTARNEVLKHFFPKEAATLEGEFINEADYERVPFEEQEDNNEFRFVNLPPQEIDRRLETEQDKQKVEALLVARAWWNKHRAQSAAVCEAGEPDRGDVRELVWAKNLSDCIDRNTERHVSVRGKLKTPNVTRPSGAVSTSTGRLEDLVDFGELLADGGIDLPEGDTNEDVYFD